VKKVALIAFVLALFGSLRGAQQPGLDAERPQERVRFRAVDVYLDTQDRPLAAYQFEFAAETGNMTIVGIEGGEHPAFSKERPPYYDPAALMNNRVIIAAFNTGRDLPTGRTRVARIHVQITGEQEPEYVARLQVAASTDGESIEAVPSVEQGEAK